MLLGIGQSAVGMHSDRGYFAVKWTIAEFKEINPFATPCLVCPR